MVDLEGFWSALLSEHAELILKAWADLSQAEAEAVHVHLKRMVEDEGYSDAQRQAARVALAAISQTR